MHSCSFQSAPMAPQGSSKACRVRDRGSQDSPLVSTSPLATPSPLAPSPGLLSLSNEILVTNLTYS